MIDTRTVAGYTWVVSTASIIIMIEGIRSKEATDWAWQFFVNKSKR